MKEPILSADELTHAARALLMAVIGAPHDIECNSVTVHFDSKNPGHNALNQMSRRIKAELGVLLEKLCGEPIYQIGDGNELWRDVGKDEFDLTHHARIVYDLNRSKA
ncbi:TPA: hypothetical protein SAO52_000170 [Burkholderia vietnamiensis]|nr:hypothetical protein [Burkholderia vietnamiensis]